MTFGRWEAVPGEVGEDSGTWSRLCGARRGVVGATWPFARVTLTADQVEVRCSFLPVLRWRAHRADVAKIEETDRSGMSFRVVLVDGARGPVDFSPPRPADLIDAARAMGWNVPG